MEDVFLGKKLAPEGYIYNSFGKKKYLKHAVASVTSLRRYDKKRPVALYCTPEHKKILQEASLLDFFDYIFHLPEQYRSITGFKHNVFRFMPFERNLYLDSDIIWCRKNDFLWQSFQSYDFTITGNQRSDNFFGGPKGVGVIKDVILRRRMRTLKRFGLTYLSRVQSGMIFAADFERTRAICELAAEMLQKRHLTHFRSRKEEPGRSEESCEWSLAMAMAKLKIQVYPWLQGYNSPQLDFLESYTDYDEDFNDIRCLLYSSRFVYDLKAIRIRWLRELLIRFFSLMPGKGDYLYVTPFCLHFGWYHQKKPFEDFSIRNWNRLCV